MTLQDGVWKCGGGGLELTTCPDNGLFLGRDYLAESFDHPVPSAAVSLALLEQERSLPLRGRLPAAAGRRCPLRAGHDAGVTLTSRWYCQRGCAFTTKVRL